MKPRRLADHISRAWEGPMWHGPSLRDVLVDTSAEEAAAHPIPGAHSIWEIVLHLAAWAEISTARLAGGATGAPLPEEDWPPVPEASAAEWTAATDRLAAAYRELARAVAAIDPARLDDTVAGHQHPVWSMLHGVVEHACYHGGQIILLKKMFAATSSG
jgi:uncharacterized damage-inducible protein DinB